MRKRIAWCQLSNAEIPNSIYNVSDTTNELTWDVNDNLGVFIRQSSLVLPSGYYNTSNEFTTALELALNNNDADAYTVTFDDITYKLTVTNDTGNHIQFLYDESELLNIMGWTADSDISNVVTATRPLDLRGVTQIQLESNFVGSHSYVYTSKESGSVRTFLGVVPMDRGFGETVFFAEVNNRNITKISNIPSTIEVKVVNRGGNLIDLNHFHFKLTVLIGYY
jgi:hypothetical protein